MRPFRPTRELRDRLRKKAEFQSAYLKIVPLPEGRLWPCVGGGARTLLIRKLDPKTFVHAYNVDLQMLYPWEGVVEPPFGAAWAVLAPGESTKSHAHQECETFFLVRGKGSITIDGERRQVAPGDVTFHQPFHQHVLENLSPSEDLHFITVYWEDRKQWNHEKEDLLRGRPKRVLVTAAPPTPNGELHLGHLAGPYLCGDYYARFLRLQGVDADFIFGSDDNCMYVETQAKDLGISGKEAAESFNRSIERCLEAAGIELAAYPRPWTSRHHEPLVQEFFSRLYENGELVEKEALAPFSTTDGTYLFESHIRGGCPGCGKAVVGNTCEACAWINDCVNLVDPICTLDGKPPVFEPLKRLVFPLSRHERLLRSVAAQAGMTSHVRALVEDALDQGLPDVAVTHPTTWGIEVPISGWEDQRIYVWLEMAPRYFAYAQHVNDSRGLTGGYEHYFKSPDAQIVQFFGFDNSFYYSLLLPALFKAYDRDIRLPNALVTNEFYLLDGAKFSTTRDHRILGETLFGSAPRDAVRFFLAYSSPELEETNFTMEAFHEILRGELQGRWLPWLRDLGRRSRRLFDGTVPATGDWIDNHHSFLRRIEELLKVAEQAYQARTFSPQRATRAMMELVREARRFGVGERFWADVETRSEEKRTAFALEALAAKALAIMAAPILPDLSRVLLEALGASHSPGEDLWSKALDWVEPGAELSSLETTQLIPNLEDYLSGRSSSIA